MGAQPREHPVPCRYAKRGDTRHVTPNINRVCDTCAELDRELAEAKRDERYARRQAEVDA